MPLPVTKGELNRLGDRLIASDSIAPADLRELAVVLTAYQQVLEQVKRQLRDLGFSAAGRVKTTGTLTDKLRRIPGMELSRMQDLAGARIVVHDVGTQDKATEKIRAFYESLNCACKTVDRRQDPRFGYRAMHLIVRIDGMPVEIQIRTELQDAWAQIVERLGDRWGRGIRYGEDPGDTHALVRSGELVASRRGAVRVLMQLSDALAQVEDVRASMIANEGTLAYVAGLMESWKELGPDGQQRLSGRIPPEIMPIRDAFLETLARAGEAVDASLLTAGAEMTGAQVVQLAERCYSLLSGGLNARAQAVHDAEQRLRDILQLIAEATDGEGE